MFRKLFFVLLLLPLHAYSSDTSGNWSVDYNSNGDFEVNFWSDSENETRFQLQWRLSHQSWNDVNVEEHDYPDGVTTQSVTIPRATSGYYIFRARHFSKIFHGAAHCRTDCFYWAYEDWIEKNLDPVFAGDGLVDQASGLNDGFTDEDVSSIGHINIVPNDYDLYVNAAGDIYLQARDRVVLIAGNITIPLILPPEKDSYVLMRQPGDVDGYGAVVIDNDYDLTGFTKYSGLALNYDGSLFIPRVGSMPYSLTLANNTSNVRLLAIDEPYQSQAVAKPDIAAIELDRIDRTGLTSGQFNVDESGSVNYSIDIYTAPGTAGVAPEMSLFYSSQSGNGIAGKGWSIGGLNAVTRCRQTLHQDMQSLPLQWNEDDRFCLDGQRLLLKSGTYGGPGSIYATEIDSYATIEAVGGVLGDPEYFKVSQKDGSTTYFGRNESTQFDDKASLNVSNSKTLTWSISHFEDNVGNDIFYRYFVDDGRQYISEISYAFGASTSKRGAYLKFNYVNRDDVNISYTAGERFGLKKRLSSVQSFNQGEILRHYDVKYVPSSIGDNKIARVESIQECADSTQLLCKQPLTFKWSKAKHNDYIGTVPNIISTNIDTFFEYILLDIDGDGDNDMVTASQGYGNNTIVLKVYRATTSEDGTVSYAQTQYSANSLSTYSITSHVGYASILKNLKLQAIDFNLDGRQDLLFHHGSWKVLASVPVKKSSANTDWYLNASPINLNLSGHSARFVDLNGDSVPEFLSDTTVAAVKLKQPVDNQYPYEYGLKVPYAIKGLVISGANTRVLPINADFNGDGQTDFIVRIHQSSQNQTSYYAVASLQNDLATESYTETELVQLGPGHAGEERTVTKYRLVDPYIGKSLFKIATYTNEQINDNKDDDDGDNIIDIADSWVRAQDFNADGVTDFMVRRGSHWHFYLNAGNGYPVALKNTVSPACWQSPLITSTCQIYSPSLGTLASQYSIAHSQIEDSFTLQDMNSDGYADLLWYKEDSGWRYRSYNPKTFRFGSERTKSITGISDTASHYQRTFVDLNGDANPEYLSINTQGANDKANIYIRYSDQPFREPPQQITGFINGMGAVTTVDFQPLTNPDVYSRLQAKFDHTETSRETCHNYGFYDGIEQCHTTISYATDPSNYYDQLRETFGHRHHAVMEEADVPIFEVFSPAYVVAHSYTDAPSADNYTSRVAIAYHYSEAKIQAAGRGYLGFKQVSSVDLQTGIRTETEYRQDWPFIGRPMKTQVFSPQGDLMSLAESTWGLQNWDDYQTQGSTAVAAVSSKASYKTAATNKIANDVPVMQAIAKHTGTRSLGAIRPYLMETKEQSFAVSSHWDDQSNKPVFSVEPTVARSGITTTYQDDYGNITKVETKTYEGDIASANLVITEKTEHEYQPTGMDSTYALAMGRLSESTSTFIAGPKASNPNAPTKVKSSRFSYFNSDTETLVEHTGIGGTHYAFKGMLKSETVRYSSSGQGIPNADLVTTYHFYDRFGNKTFTKSVADSNGNNEKRFSSRTEYDSLGRYAQKTYSLIGQGNATQWTEQTVSEVIKRDKHGTPTQTRAYIGSNAFVTNLNQFTAMGNSYFQSSSVGGWSQTITARTADLSYEACPDTTSYYSKTTNADGSFSAECFNKTGQSLRKIARHFNGLEVANDTEYDVLSRVTRASEPYFFDNQPIKYWNASDYDIMGNALRVTAPDGVAQWRIYEGFKTTEKSFNGSASQGTKQIERSTWRNALDQVVKVEEGVHGDADTHSTSLYRYDVHGNLTQLIDDDNNTTYIEYDDIGRKIAMWDPDKGSPGAGKDGEPWRYQYNGFGNQTCQQDPKGQLIYSEYDFSGRAIKRVDMTASDSCELRNGQIEAEMLSIFDTADYGWGKLEAIEDTVSEYSQIGSFDNKGRASETLTIIKDSNGNLTEHFEKVTYDSLGRLSSTYDAARQGADYTQNKIVNVYNSYGYLYKVLDGATNEPYYQVETMDQRGNVTKAYYGDNIEQTSAYRSTTGLANWMSARQRSSGSVLQSYDVEWDDARNLVSRTNRTGANGAGTAFANEHETFTYDHLNRLLSYQVGSTHKTVKYDSLGNIRQKSDMGNYTYSQQASSICPSGILQAGPHAVTQVSGNHQASYCYDLNGNMVKDTERSLDYTVFDKVKRLQKGSRVTEFSYSPARTRYMRVDRDGNNTTETLYIGGVQKITNDDGIIEWKRDLLGIGQITHKVSEQGDILDSSTHYFLKDHLGSITQIVNADGSLQQEMAFDPWGKRRQADNWQHQLQQSVIDAQFSLVGNNVIGSAITSKGFTGHEMLDGFDIVHMNGRIYDAALGRFLQADPHIQAPTLTQSLNRYSYVLNNPLNATDPSGFFFKKLVKGILKATGVWSVLKAIAKNQILSSVVSIALNFVPGCQAWCSALFQSATTFVTTGSLTAAFKSAAISFATAHAFSQIAGKFENAAWAKGGIKAGKNLSLNAKGFATLVAAQGVVGGISSVLQGGKFGHGFASAAASKLAAPVIAGIDGPTINDLDIGQATVAAVIGGTSSKLTGGKFANGAITGAMVNIFNQQTGIKKTAQKGNGLVNPTGKGVRGCDTKGCGHYGASRVRNGKPGTHVGADYITDAGQDVVAISDGKVVRLPTGSYEGVVVGDGNGTSWKILYLDVDQSLSIGDSVTAGQVLGTAQDLTTTYPGITNHVHVKLRINNKVVDPDQHIPSP